MRTALFASLVVGVAFVVTAAGTPACSSSTTTPSSQPAADSGSSESRSEGEGADSGSTEPAGPMTLTSSAFEDGDELPSKHTCDGTGDVSPPFSWTPGPEGTSSYAIIFKDNTNGLVHSAIYDIPADVSSLPQGVEGEFEPSEPAGAKQSLNYKKESGYAGPCPPDGEHEYVFTLYALKVDKLTGPTKDSTASAVEKAVLKEDLASSKLTTRYTRK